MSPWSDYGKYATIGIEIALSVVFGYFGGRYLGEKYHIPYLTWVGFGLGVVSSFWQLYKITKTLKQRLEREEGLVKDDDPSSLKTGQISDDIDSKK